VNRARVIAIVQALVVMMLFSFGNVLMKIVLFDINPITYAWVTVGIAMIILSIYTFIVQKERVPTNLSKRVWFYIVAIGLCNFMISRFATPLALQRLPVVTYAYIHNFTGFITMVMSIYILKEKPTIYQWVGAVIAIIGIRIFFIVGPTSYELVGLLFILVGITAVAYSNNITRKLAIVTNNKISNNIVSTFALLIGGTVTLVIGFAFDWPPKISGWNNWGIILYSAIINTAFGLTLWNKVLRTLRSYEAGVLGTSMIIFATIFAVLILGETLTVYKVLGMLLLLLGLILVQVRKNK